MCCGPAHRSLLWVKKFMVEHSDFHTIDPPVSDAKLVPPETSRWLFQMFDSQKDGVLTEDEFHAGIYISHYSPGHEQRFENMMHVRMLHPYSVRLQTDDLDAVRRLFLAWDSDASGRVSISEWVAGVESYAEQTQHSIMA